MNNRVLLTIAAASLLVGCGSTSTVGNGVGSGETSTLASKEATDVSVRSGPVGSTDVFTGGMAVIGVAPSPPATFDQAVEGAWVTGTPTTKGDNSQGDQLRIRWHAELGIGATVLALEASGERVGGFTIADFTDVRHDDAAETGPAPVTAEGLTSQLQSALVKAGYRLDHAEILSDGQLYAVAATVAQIGPATDTLSSVAQTMNGEGVAYLFDVLDAKTGDVALVRSGVPWIGIYGAATAPEAPVANSAP